KTPDSPPFTTPRKPTLFYSQFLRPPKPSLLLQYCTYTKRLGRVAHSSLLTAKSSNRARSRMTFNFATRATDSSCDTSKSRICTLHSMIAKVLISQRPGGKRAQEQA